MCDLLAWIGLALLIWPVPLGPVPKPFDLHRVSFCIGPALYQYGHDVLPARDMFSQYGSGQGFFFGFFLADDAIETVRRFYVLYAIVTLVFFLLAYSFLSRLFGSRMWAFAVCALAIVCQFYDATRDIFSLHPSIGVYRIAPLIPIAWLFTWWCIRAGRPGATLILGASLGLAIFWQTDSGLACLAACLGTGLLLVRPLMRAVAAAFFLAAVSVATFLIVAALAYGPGAWGLAFLRGLFAPWLWYTGFGVLTDWYPFSRERGYTLSLGALVAAMTFLATASLPLGSSPRRISMRRSGLAFLASLSLFLHAKCVIRPQFCYWAGSALPSLALLAWMCRSILPDLYRGLLETTGIFPGRTLPRRVTQMLGALTALSAATWLACTGYYTTHPSFFNLALCPSRIEATRPQDESAYPFRTEADIDLIRKNTQASERTAIVSEFDWAFLLEAKRPPRYFFLPMTTTLAAHYDELIRETLEAPVLFVDRRSLAFLTTVAPTWQDRFVLAAEADNLLLYRPRPPT